MKRALVTGAAGFIGSHVVDNLLAEGWEVTALDNFDPFYSPSVKRANTRLHLLSGRYRLLQIDIRDLQALQQSLPGNYDAIVHLAAKAGVRPSIERPLEYQETNVKGTQNLLELARLWHTPQFVFASSSSVYGLNANVPWKESDSVLLPISPYASTKVSGELLGHVYSHLFGIRFVALRFFTVFGPRQRPDLAIHKFTRLIQSGQAVPVYGDGKTLRDYTFVLDIVAGIRAAISYTGSCFEIINLGNDKPVNLLYLIERLSEVIGVNPAINFFPEQAGDVPQTWASIEKAHELLGYQPKTGLPEGLDLFVKWLATSDEMISQRPLWHRSAHA